MRSIIVLLLAAAFTVPTFSNALGEDQTRLVQHATAMSLRALDFNQGSLPSLLDSEKDFTSEGWTEFKMKLSGWLDEKGATTFSSVFVPSGPALDVRRHDRVMYLTIPGVLKHESRNQYGGISTTQYRAEIDIQLLEASQKIRHLKQRACGGASAQSSCR